jgi:hypothetical protein
MSLPRLLIINLLFPCYELGRVEANSSQLPQLFRAEVYVSLGVWAPSTPALIIFSCCTFAHTIFADSDWHNGPEREKLCSVKWL